MYVINPSAISQGRLYECSGVIANWLIYTRHFPLFGKSQAGKFIFVKTPALEKALEEMPFHLKVAKILF